MLRLAIVLLHGLGCAVLSADALVKDCEQTQGQFCRRGYVLQCPACTTQYCSDGVCAEDMVTTKNPLTGKVVAECGRRMFCMVKSLDGDYCDGKPPRTAHNKDPMHPKKRRSRYMTCSAGRPVR